MRRKKILVAALLVVSMLPAFGQKVTLNYRNRPLKAVFTAVTQQTGYSFMYSSQVVNLDTRVSISVKKEELPSVMNRLLNGTNIGYTIRGKEIVLFKRNNDIRGESKGKHFTTRNVTIPVTGFVKDETGMPVIGANIRVIGSSKGTITDSNGRFVLDKVEDNDQLLVSYMGYRSQTINYNGERNLQVVLQQDNRNLNELVVLAYGSQVKRDITGSVVQLKSDKLNDMPVTQFAQQLQGKIAGVQISQYSGRVGSGMAFRIRGAASLSSGNQPLIVVDGIPLTGDFNEINPAEISSFSVLKDASASALYGSRAANGVILITTHKAEVGQSRIDIFANYGIQSIPQKGRPKMMTAREFAEFMNEYYEDRVKYEGYKGKLDPLYVNPERYGKGTNWFDVMTRTAPVQNYDIQLSSGSQNSLTTAMLGYSNQEGVVINTGVKEISARLNQTYFFWNKKLEIGMNLAPSYRMDHNSLTNYDGVGSLFNKAIQASPLIAPVDENGEMPLLVNTPPMLQNINPYKIMKERINDYRTFFLLGSAYISLRPIEGLTLKSTLSTNLKWRRQQGFSPASITVPAPGIASGTSAYMNSYMWISETNATYNKTLFDKHKIEIMLGMSAQKAQQESNSVSGSNFTSDDIPYLSAATQITAGTSGVTEYALLSFLGRLNYSFNDKYLLSASIRRDGSSRFGRDNRYGYFPSVSGGWIVSSEKFMEDLHWLNLLKIRASYGVTGNDNIGNYTHIANIGEYNYVFNGNIVPGSTISNLPNYDLGWEQTKQFDFGVDVSLFNNRLSFTYDFYDKRTDNVIQERPLPQASGFSSVTSNVGKIHFWGHEFSINYEDQFGELKWQSNFNISFDRNKIVYLVKPGYIVRNQSEYSDYYRNQEGYPLGMFYGYIKLGLYKDEADLANSPKYKTSQVGTIKYKDVNGDGVIDVKDRTFIGNPNPKFIFGFTNNFNWRNWDLGISMSGSYGGKVLSSLTYQYLGNLDGAFNVLEAVKYRWRSPENPGKGDYPRTLTGTTEEGRKVNTSWIQSNSYVAVKNITLGYTFALPHKWLMKRLRIYTSVQNALLLTKYTGSNPEISLNGLDGTGIGIDENAYPVARVYSFGLNVSF